MGIRIVNKSPFNQRIRLGMTTVSIPRHTVWTCPLGQEGSIDARTIDRRHLKVCKVTDEEVKAALIKEGKLDPAVADVPTEEPDKSAEPVTTTSGKASGKATGKGKSAESDWPS